MTNKSESVMSLNLLLMVLIFFSVPVYGGDARNEVDARIYIIQGMLLTDDYKLHDKITGRLSGGEEETINLSLDGRGEYLIYGVCDNDCYDIDLFFHDRNGSLLAQDREGGRTPYIIVPKGFDDTYLVTISMTGCETYTCNYGLAVFGRF